MLDRADAEAARGVDVAGHVVHEDRLGGRDGEQRDRQFEDGRVGLGHSDLVRVNDRVEELVEGVPAELLAPGAVGGVADDRGPHPRPQ
jgi:hypothetical protein